jgi:hypothetical protein
MFGHIQRAVVTAFFLLLAALQPSFADNLSSPGLQQPFNWQTAWGGINFVGGPDPGIPSAQLQPKEDIKNVISTDGTQTSDLSSLGVYSLDINGDGIPDYVSDGNGYFPQYQNPNAALQICTAANGCFVSVYLSGQKTDLIAAPAAGSPACPATATNTSCIPSCAATQQNCPALFQYNTRTIFDQQVLQWNFISAATFQDWATGTSYQIVNTNPVFVTLVNNANCYNDELAQNNNQCIKYYQYVGDASTGNFVDLYNYLDTMTGEYGTRFTYTPFDRATAYLAPGMVMGDGFGLKLSSGGTIDIQFSNFTYTNGNGTVIPTENTRYGFPAMPGVPAQPGVVSFHITNSSTNNYFVPTNTSLEFSSFANSHQQGVTVAPEQLQFTPWVGDTQCPAMGPAPEAIAASRFCQSSTSAYRPCQECIDAKVPGYEQGCAMTQKCTTTACIVADWVTKWKDGVLASYAGTYTTLADCEAGTGLWPILFGPQRWAHNTPGHIADFCNGTSGGQSFLAAVCAQGHVCLAGDTMISLPDGQTKRIDQIKAGDMVLGFKKSKEALKPYKVSKLAITPGEKLVEINDRLKLTPNHWVITGKGGMVPASALKVGDVLLRSDRTKLTIKTIDTVPATSTVYNLQLEVAGAGFVADDIRVMGYGN